VNEYLVWLCGCISLRTCRCSSMQLCAHVCMCSGLVFCDLCLIIWQSTPAMGPALKMTWPLEQRVSWVIFWSWDQGTIYTLSKLRIGWKGKTSERGRLSLGSYLEGKNSLWCNVKTESNTCSETLPHQSVRTPTGLWLKLSLSPWKDNI
jgi:hypothetical protein